MHTNACFTLHFWFHTTHAVCMCIHMWTCLVSVFLSVLVSFLLSVCFSLSPTAHILLSCNSFLNVIMFCWHQHGPTSVQPGSWCSCRQPGRWQLAVSSQHAARFSCWQAWVAGQWSLWSVSHSCGDAEHKIGTEVMLFCLRDGFFFFLFLLLLRSPAISLGFTILVRFLRMWPFLSNRWGSHIPSSWMVHAGCVFVASIHWPRSWMSRSLEPVWWNACEHRLDLGLYSYPKEFFGNGVRTHVNPYSPGYSYESSANRDPDTRSQVGGPSTGICVHG